MCVYERKQLFWTKKFASVENSSRIIASDGKKIKKENKKFEHFSINFF